MKAKVVMPDVHVESKLPAAAPPSPDWDPVAFKNRCDARDAALRGRIAEIERVREFLDLSRHELLLVDAILLASSRTNCGKNGPIEKFICELVHRYARSEADGEGLTVEDVEGKLEELRENMDEALGEAFFIADRYKRPETAAKEETQ